MDHSQYLTEFIGRAGPGICNQETILNIRNFAGIALLLAACTPDDGGSTHHNNAGSGGTSQGGSGGTTDVGSGGTGPLPTPVGGSGGTREVPPPPVKEDCSKQFVSFDGVFEEILSDVLKQDDRDRPFLRYVSLTNRYNAGVCNQDLESDRWAISKFFNSVSTSSRVTRPVSVNREETLYRIDLRDYGLVSDDWTAIVADNAYAVEFTGDTADIVKTELEEPIPFMFADSIIDVASLAPLYYDLLKLSDTKAGLISDLGVDLEDDLDSNRTVLAGTAESGISQQERVAQRNDARVGYYWESFDLNPDGNPDPDAGVASAFANPIGFADESQESEAFFTLPNGLQGYVIFNNDGTRLNESSILLDKLTQNDGVMRVGVSCMTCHPGGPVPFKDQVRQFAIDNQLVVAQDFQQVLDLYPAASDLVEVFLNDASIYGGALTRTGVPTQEADPVSNTFVRFDKDVDLVTFAGDLHFPSNQLEREINRLNPALAGLDDGFKVDRDDAKNLYCESLKVVSVSLENQPVCEEE